MPMRVYVYSHKAYNEYRLENNDEECVISITREFFQISANVNIIFNRLEDKWFFGENGQYVIYQEDVPYLGEVLSCGCLYKLVTNHKESLYLYAVESEDRFVTYNKYDISNISKITIGSYETNTIQFQNLSLISRFHATIEKFHKGIILEDLSCNGVFVNNKKLDDTRTYLTFGSKIFIYGLEMIYLGDVLAINIQGCDDFRLSNAMIKYYEQMPIILDNVRENTDNIVYYNRMPRGNTNEDKTVVKIMSKPNIDVTIDTTKYFAAGKENLMLFIMLLGVGAVATSMYYEQKRIAIYILIAMIGCAISYLVFKVIEKYRMLKTIRYNKEKESRSRRLYEKYLSEREEYIVERIDKNRRYQENRYKDASEYVEYDYTNMELWNRNCNHNDFLKYRIGSGSVSSNIEFDLPHKDAFKNDYRLYNKVINLRKKYRIVKDMPICIDLLKDRIIGVVSENKNMGARDILNILCTQISVNNCYTDVKIALAYDETEADLSFYKWMPHIWTNNKNMRYIAKNEEQAKVMFNELYNSLLKDEGNPYFVVFATKPVWLIKEPLFRLLQEKNKTPGFSVVLLANYCQELPNICEIILQNDGKFNGILNVKTQKRTRIEFDQVEEGKVAQLVKRLASIHVPHENKENIKPKKCTLLQTFGVTSPAELDIENRWKNNKSYEGLNMPIGFDMDNKPFSLNVHEKYYGPHGLIAGTTGSGKSELLKSMIISLAINYSPNEVNFLIIDYKGAIMSNELEGLPHIVGNISNLSRRHMDKVISTIKGEIDRREKLLGVYGVNNIDMLIKLYKCGELMTKIPYLFIIVDEFAQLKEQEPEFIKEIISISQVGRSLGINLVLSTQKPSGNIDDNIWSNARYKICLKVANEQDSIDVLHKSDAVRINNVGGAFVQVGNDEIYEEIQTAYTKEIYDEELVDRESIAEIVEFNGIVNHFNLGKILKRKELLKIRFLEKLIYMLISINKETNIIYSNELVEKDFECVVNKLYDAIKSEEIEYKHNAINTKKLCNFVGLFIMLDKRKSKTIHEQALEIVKMSIEEDVQLPEVSYKTELDAIKNLIIKETDKITFEKNSLWLGELSTVVDLRQIPNCKDDNYFKATIGVYDDPYNQQRGRFSIDFVDDGHTIIYGEMLSGKSTLLQTVVFDLIKRYSDRELAIYGIDYNNGASIAFEDANVVRKLYINQNSDVTVVDVLDEVYDLIHSRKEKYTGSEIIQKWSDVIIEEPLVVLVIDDIAKLCNAKAGIYENKIAYILKEGMGVGVYVLATANNMGTNGVASRVAHYFKTSICLQLKDKYEYMQYLHYVGEMVIPEKNIPGRGIALINNRVLEFQVALYNGEVNDSSRLEAIRMECKKINKKNKPRTILENAKNITKEKNKKNKTERKEGIKEATIKVDKKKDAKELNIKEIKIKLPVTWTNHKNNKSVKKCLKENKLPLGAYLEDEDSMYCINLDSTFMYTVVGEANTGKSGIMKVLMSLASLNKKDKVYIVDFTGSLYTKVAQRIKANYVTTSEEFVAMCEDLAEEFARRKETPKAEKIYVFGDMERFIKAIYMPLKSGIDARAFMENISQKGSGYNIYFIMEMDIKAQRKLKGYDVYNNFINYNTGICTTDCDFDYDNVEGINIPIIRG